MKLMFMATHPLQTSGYARVGYRISNFLAEHYDVIYYGFSSYNLSPTNRNIHKNIQLIDAYKESPTKDPFGFDIFKKYVQEHNPDIIMIYNDILITCQFLNVINKMKKEGHNFKVINYLDLVYDYQDVELVNFALTWCDKIMVFSEHWRKNLEDMKLDVSKVEILPHGFDEDKFQELEMSLARKILNLNENDFIILNNNKNIYRKAHDIGISAFLQFLKMTNLDPKVKFFIHCDLKSFCGYDIRKLIYIECQRLNLDPDFIMNNHILTSPESLIDDKNMNDLYNACDVGINTCVGEGFGLCNLEHMALGKPQIVSRVGGLKDIFMHYPEFTVEPITEINISPQTDAHVGLIRICSSRDFADKLYKIYNNKTLYNNWANNCKQYIRAHYSWNKINLNLLKILKSL